MSVLRARTPRRSAFATTEFSEARAFMETAYGGSLRIGNWEPSWQLAVDQVATDQVATGEVRMPADLTYQVDGHDELVVITVLDGAATYAGDGFDQRMGPGTVYAGNHPTLHCLCHTHELHARTVTLPRSLMASVADDAAPESGDRWELTAIGTTTAAARQWQQASNFLDSLLDDPNTSAAPLVTGQATRLLAALALAIFPNTSTARPDPVAGPDAHPATLRRAMSFIEANPHRDLTIGDVARAASVTPRAIQLAFRRHLDTTPTAYLRRVRLAHAREDLLNADPDSGITVSRIANDWGFPDPSRFAARYRDAYSELPSETLHR